MDRAGRGTGNLDEIIALTLGSASGVVPMPPTAMPSPDVAASSLPSCQKSQ